MQFSDRVRIENNLFHLYGPYGSTTRNPPSHRQSLENILRPVNEMQFSVYGLKTYCTDADENNLFHLYCTDRADRQPVTTLHTGKA